MRNAVRVGTVALALCAGILPAMPAMAATSVTVASADEDVPVLQESPLEPGEFDEGPIPDTAPTAVDDAPIGAQVITECEPGFGKWTWTGKKSPWTVTHQTVYENFSGSSITKERTAAHELTITASGSVTAGLKFEASTIVAKLDTQVSYTLAASGSHTSTGSEKYTSTMKTGHIYVTYAGARRVSGQYTYSVCNSTGTATVVKSRGKATSFGLKREGMVQCGASVPADTLGYVAERNFC